MENKIVPKQAKASATNDLLRSFIGLVYSFWTCFGIWEVRFYTRYIRMPSSFPAVRSSGCLNIFIRRSVEIVDPCERNIDKKLKAPALLLR